MHDCRTDISRCGVAFLGVAFISGIAIFHRAWGSFIQLVDGHVGLWKSLGVSSLGALASFLVGWLIVRWANTIIDRAIAYRDLEERKKRDPYA